MQEIYYIKQNPSCAIFAATLFWNIAGHLLHKTNPSLSYFKLSYVFWEHNDSVGRGTTVLVYHMEDGGVDTMHCTLNKCQDKPGRNQMYQSSRAYCTNKYSTVIGNDQNDLWPHFFFWKFRGVIFKVHAWESQ